MLDVTIDLSQVLTCTHVYKHTGAWLSFLSVSACFLFFRLQGVILKGALVCEGPGSWLMPSIAGARGLQGLAAGKSESG